MARYRLALLDVNETLVDLGPLRARIAAAGAPPDLLGIWFASTLRDGFALAASGGYADFRTVGHGVLTALLAGVDGLDGAPAEVADGVLAGFAELPPQPDVAEGLRTLEEARVAVATLTVGDARVTDVLLRRAGLRDLVGLCLSVDEVRRWKPAPEPYLHAVALHRVAPGDAVLIASHPWDVDGAMRAGLAGAHVDRGGAPYPAAFAAPTLTAVSFAEAAARIAT